MRLFLYLRSCWSNTSIKSMSPSGSYLLDSNPFENISWAAVIEWAVFIFPFGHQDICILVIFLKFINTWSVVCSDKCLVDWSKKALLRLFLINCTSFAYWSDFHILFEKCNYILSMCLVSWRKGSSKTGRKVK